MTVIGKNLTRKSVRTIIRFILMCSLLIAPLFVFYSSVNLSNSESQSLGWVTIRAIWQDGCPVYGAHVEIYQNQFSTLMWVSITNVSGLASVQGILTQGYYDILGRYKGELFWEEGIVVDENGNADCTMIYGYSNHPNAFIMNLTSTTNNILTDDNMITFNDSSTTKDLTFGGNETKIVWVRLPKESIVHNAQLKLDIVPLNYTAWDDTEDYYSYQGNGFYLPASNAVDENWTTQTQMGNDGWWGPGGDTQGWVNETYNLPAYWQDIVKIEGQFKAARDNTGSIFYFPTVETRFWNYTGSSWSFIGSCNNLDSIGTATNYTYVVDSYDFLRVGQTFNISTYLASDGCTNAHYYEGQVRWGVGSVPTNPFLSVGNDSSIEWYHNGKFNNSETISNLSTAINDYLLNATAGPNEFVDVPLSLHSDTAGIIRISNVNIDYGYNTSFLYDTYLDLHIGYSINHTTYRSQVIDEICCYGFYVDNNAPMARVDGIDCPLKIKDGHKYVEFIELTIKGAYWKNHIIWWNTLSPHNVAVTSVSPSKTESLIGQVVNITVHAINEGIYPETFNVTVYYDTNPIETQEVADLAPGGQIDLTFNWNTIGIPVDTYYAISANASIVAGELDLVDNTLTNGTIVIRTLRTTEVAPCDYAGNPKSSFETGSMAYFTVKINNTAIETSSLLMTINIYDSNDTAIGVASFQGPITHDVSTFIIGVPIPSSAHPGNATVYANAFTDWPRNGGTPYCPEASATFQIIVT